MPKIYQYDGVIRKTLKCIQGVLTKINHVAHNVKKYPNFILSSFQRIEG